MERFLIVEKGYPIAKQYYTIIVVGSFYSGKTEFIRSISDVVGYITIPNHLHVECGQINIDETTALLLVSEGTTQLFRSLAYIGMSLVGIVVVLNSVDSMIFREVKAFTNILQAYAPVPYIVACNPFHRGSYGPTTDQINNKAYDFAWDVEDIRHYLRLPDKIPMQSYDVKNREQVKAALLSLLQEVERESADDLPEFIENEPQFFATTPDEFFTEQKTRKWLLVTGTGNGLNEFTRFLINKNIWLYTQPESLPYWHGYREIDSNLELHIKSSILSKSMSAEELIIPSLAQRDGILGFIGFFHSRTPEDVSNMRLLIPKLKSFTFIIVDTASVGEFERNVQLTDLEVLRQQLNLPDNVLLLRDWIRDESSAQRVLDALLNQIHQTSTVSKSDFELAARIRTTLKYD